MKVPLSWLQEFVTCGKHPEDLGLLLTMSGLECDDITTVGKETVLEFGVLPNRGDCLSIYGVATEVAAVCDVAIAAGKARALKTKGTIADHLTVRLEDPERCPRYAARCIAGVKIGPSPANVQQRLEAAGMRPVNNVVDATNYVLLELGQPLHAFDARQLAKNEIVIRTAGKKMTFETLDGEKHTLLPEDLVICDGERPVALAGIMGGANSEIQESSTDIVLESAYFEPKGVRRTSKRLGCMTESSRRFERGVDPERVVTALQRVTELICDWAGGTPTEDWIDHYPETITPKHIPLPVKEVERLLGLALDAKTCRAMLTRLGCAVGGSSITLEVSVPTARHDLARPADLVEEIARIHGYDKIEATLSDFSPQPLHRPDGWDAMAMCLERLRASGFSEAVHYAFVPTSTDQHFPMAGRTPVPMNNPLGHEPNVLKTTLVAGLVESAARNRRHGQESVRLCELRPVFSSQEDGVEEHVALSGIMVGRRHPFGWTQVQDMVDFFDVKGLVEQIAHWMALADWRWESQDPPRFLHPGRAAWIADAHSPIGFCGELHPDVQRLYGLDEATLVFELDWERLVRRQAERHVQFTAMAKHPGIRRDVSLLAESTLASQAVVEAIRATKAPWITEVTLFDCYEGKGMPEGKKSLAYAVQYHDPSRTLTDDEVNAVHERVVEHVVKTLGVDVRK